MRRSLLSVLAIGSAALIPTVAPAGQPFDAAQGGGQVVLSGQELSRSGNTISFSAQTNPNGLTGSVQYVETALAGGDDPGRVPTWHGAPTCLRVDGDTAEIGGSIRSGTSDETYFALLVTDNGTPAEGLDVIRMQFPDEAPDCNADWDDTDELTLARGNVTVNDAE